MSEALTFRLLIRYQLQDKLEFFIINEKKFHSISRFYNLK